MQTDGFNKSKYNLTAHRRSKGLEFIVKNQFPYREKEWDFYFRQYTGNTYRYNKRSHSTGQTSEHSAHIQHPVVLSRDNDRKPTDEWYCTEHKAQFSSNPLDNPSSK